MEPVTGAPALFLQTETPQMHMHVVGVLVLDPGDLPEWTTDRVTEVLDQRLHLIPPFRKRLVDVPAGLDHPRWIDDPEFTLRRHVHHHTLEPPGDASSLAAFVGQVASTPLPRDRPLWEMWIVTGRSDRSVALVSKVHHAIMDGAAGGGMMASLFDLSPQGEQAEGPDEPWEPDQVPGPARLAGDAAAAAMSRMGRLPATLARSAGRATAIAGAVAADRIRGTAPPITAPKTPLNGPLTAERRVALADCRLDDLRHARSTFGTTVNDVVLAAATTSLRRYLDERDALPDKPLVGSVPMSLRTDIDADDLTPRATNLMIPLPVQLDDPVLRLKTIHEHTTGAKVAPHGLGPELTRDWVGLIPIAVVRGAARAYSGLGLDRLPPTFNSIISNVAGSPVPLYLGGAEVTATYPMGPLIASTGLNLTVLSQGNALHVGVIACPDLVDDVDAVAQGFAAGVVELARSADDAEGAEPTDGSEGSAP